MDVDQEDGTWQTWFENTMTDGRPRKRIRGVETGSESFA